MSPFHIIVRALPNDCPTYSIHSGDQVVAALIVAPELQSLPLNVSFEAAAERLETFSRMFFEPDGSFVWRSSTAADAADAWQIDGNLYDRNGSLIFVDIKGTCSGPMLKQLLDSFRADESELMVENVRDAVFIRESDFMKRLVV